MKRTLPVLTFAALAISSQASAQTTATASATSTATVLSPISLSKTSDLAFGSMLKPASGSNTYTISSTGTPSNTAGVTPPTSTRSQAQFTVGGDGNQSFAITVPSSVTMTRVTGTETIPVTLTSPGATGTLASGAASFGVGGSLTLDTNTTTGAYTGSFNVTVGYN